LIMITIMALGEEYYNYEHPYQAHEIFSCLVTSSILGQIFSSAPLSVSPRINVLPLGRGTKHMSSHKQIWMQAFKNPRVVLNTRLYNLSTRHI
jgi:hypothetical protein